MKITEILDTKIHYDIDASTASQMKVHSVINNRVISVSFVFTEPDTWVMEFSEQIDNKTSTSKSTGSGGEFQVFSLISSVMSDFIDTYAPDIIMFTADDEKRAKIYMHIIKKNLKVSSGYRHSTSVITGKTTIFRLTRK